MDKNETLENLKAGDKVFYERGISEIAILTIKRTTKTMIITKGDRRFKKKSGRAVGADVWNWSKILPLTKEKAESVAIVRLREKAASLRDNLIIPKDRESLEKLIAALEPFVKSKP